MTFKHNSFQDSPTMRSLTKVAQDKGWIKDEPVVKTASPKLDLNPSKDLTENLLKLCNGLRASGFEKQANEIEDKFVVYKQAQSLYGVSGEDGEDLLNSAHPKGSHKMEDVDSNEAVFEDLLDKHQKIVSVVDKKPTGKLASTRSIIDAVKIVLAETPAAPVKSAPDLTKYTDDQLQFLINGNIDRAKELWDQIDQTIKDRGKLSYVPSIGRGIVYSGISNIIKKQLNETPMTLDIIKDIDNRIKEVMDYISPGWSGGLSEEANDVVKGFLPDFKGYVDTVIAALKEIHNRERAKIRGNVSVDPENEPKPVMTDAAAQLTQEYKNVLGQINQYQAIVNARRPKDQSVQIQWLDKRKAYLTTEMDEFNKIDPANKLAVVGPYTDRLNQIKQTLDAFKTAKLV
jgi:hypothetical protein